MSSDNPNSLPSDPISSMLEAAVSMHEMFTKLCDSGFSEDQSMRLTCAIVVGMLNNGSQE